MSTARQNQERLQEMASQIKESLTPAEIAQLIRLIAPTPTTGEMSSAEFEELMRDLNDKSTRRGYSETSLTAARLVLVMGATVAEAASETGVSRQAIHQLLKRIRRRMESLPKDWVPVSTWLPEYIAKQLEDIVESLKASHASGELLEGERPTLMLSKGING
jgi:transposase-like protein